MLLHMHQTHSCKHATSCSASKSLDELLCNDTPHVARPHMITAVCRVLPCSSTLEPGAQPRGVLAVMYPQAAMSALEGGSKAVEACMRRSQNCRLSLETKEYTKRVHEA